jgi:hypothetical protein
MMAGTTAPTKTLERAVAQAKTISGLGSTRVFQGYKRWTEAENFDGLVQALTANTQGYLVLWLAGLSSGGRLGSLTITIAGELTIPVAKDSSADGSDMWDFVESIRQALEDQTDYGSGEFPGSCEIVLRELDLERRFCAVFDVRLIALASSI